MTMHWILAQLIEDIELTGHISTGANAFLAYHDCLEICEHSKRVAVEARPLAARFGVDKSLVEAVLCYVDYLWQRRHTLPVVHPWLEAAYRQLSAMRNEIY